MNILVCADSRGFKANGESAWIKMVRSRGGDIPFSMDILGGKETKIRTMFHLVRILDKTDKRYDLAILHLGHHEWDVTWSKAVWRSLVGNELNTDFLVRDKDADGTLYWNKDYGLIRRTMERIQHRADNVLMIGMHSWRKGSTRNPLRQTPGHHIAILEMNELFSSLSGVDYLHMPMHYSWTSKNSYDGVHYNKDQNISLAQMVLRYIRRLSVTIDRKLQEAVI